MQACIPRVPETPICMTNGILTLPLNENYGGLLQAYALQNALASMGQTANILNYYPCRHLHIPTPMPWMLGYYIRLLGFKKNKPITYPPKVKKRLYEDFAKKHLSLSPFLPVRELQKQGAPCDRIIAGSDQLWRRAYTDHIAPPSFFFLQFVPEEVRRRSIAYAVSFGTNQWQGSAQETEECGSLLRQFKAVSVRETSGISICRNTFGVDAVQMPDPTFLLLPETYRKLWRKKKRSHPYIASYLLDSSPDKLATVEETAARMGLPVRQLMPRLEAPKRSERSYLSVTQWLRALDEACCVVTDSFHGCVFSLIFHKPFACFGNENRGSARFESLFATYNQENCLSSSAVDLVCSLQRPMDWDAIGHTLSCERERGLAFLSTCLSEEEDD